MSNISRQIAIKALYLHRITQCNAVTLEINTESVSWLLTIFVFKFQNCKVQRELKKYSTIVRLFQSSFEYQWRLLKNDNAPQCYKVLKKLPLKFLDFLKPISELRKLVKSTKARRTRKWNMYFSKWLLLNSRFPLRRNTFSLMLESRFRVNCAYPRKQQVPTSIIRRR